MKILNRCSLFLIMLSVLCLPFRSSISNSEKTSPKFSIDTNEKTINRKQFEGIHHASERLLRGVHARKQFVDIQFRPFKQSSNKKSRIANHRFSPMKIKSSNTSDIKKFKAEENLIRLAKSIKQEAKNHHLKIKKVLLGAKVKKTLKDKKLGRHLSNLLSSSSRPLNRRLKSLKRKIRKSNKAQIKKRKRYQQRKKELSKQGLTKSSAELARSLAGGATGGSSAGGDKDDMSKFNFLPGYAGMPFPPFMMNGPHYHPPLNVTVNAIPNLDARRELSPLEIEEENMRTQADALQPLEDQMRAILEQMRNIDGDVATEMDKHYQKILHFRR